MSATEADDGLVRAAVRDVTCYVSLLAFPLVFRSSSRTTFVVAITIKLDEATPKRNDDLSKDNEAKTNNRIDDA